MQHIAKKVMFFLFVIFYRLHRMKKALKPKSQLISQVRITAVEQWTAAVVSPSFLKQKHKHLALYKQQKNLNYHFSAFIFQHVQIETSVFGCETNIQCILIRPKIPATYPSIAIPPKHRDSQKHSHFVTFEATKKIQSTTRC